MKIIVCEDLRGGRMFNRRRQSRDSGLTADVIRLLSGETLRLPPYSAPLFAFADQPLCITSAYLTEAEEGDWCFSEGDELAPFAGHIDTLVIYRWNKVYPSDVTLDVDPAALGLTLAETGSFEGHSHMSVTREVWKK